MSAVGQKRTNRRRPKSTFVRFGPKADKRGRDWIVRYVPISNMDAWSEIGIGARRLILRVPCHTTRHAGPHRAVQWVEVTTLSLIHISEPTRLGMISYA